MSDTITIPATKFTRDFPLAQEAAREHGVVQVQNHNRLVGAFLSPVEYKRYEQLKKQERQVHKVGELPDDMVAALEAAVADDAAY